MPLSASEGWGVAGEEDDVVFLSGEDTINVK